MDRSKWAKTDSSALHVARTIRVDKATWDALEALGQNKSEICRQALDEALRVLTPPALPVAELPATKRLRR